MKKIPCFFFFTWVSDANHEQLAEHICHHLHSRLTHNMAADQVNGGGEQARTGSRRLHPDFLMLAVQEVIGTVAHELGEGMPWFKKKKGKILNLCNKNTNKPLLLYPFSLFQTGKAE